MQFPYEEVVNVYVQRWEIELGFREMKQTLHQAKLTLRSKKPEMVRQELWGLLVAYNLIRMMMLDAVKDMPELSPSRLSFGLCMRHIIVFFLTTLPETVTKLPAHYEYLMESLRMMRLPDKRPDRYYPRVVRKDRLNTPQRKMPVSLTDWHYAVGGYFCALKICVRKANGYTLTIESRFTTVGVYLKLSLFRLSSRCIFQCKFSRFCCHHFYWITQSREFRTTVLC